MMKKSSGGIVNILLSVSMLIIVTLACNLPRNDTRNLHLDSTAADGSISGSYSSSGGSGDYKVNFSVTKDGFATFHLEGAPVSDTLIVNLSNEYTASMEWKGNTLDGFGALTMEEQAALDDLMGSELAYSLGMIPLDIGCLGEDEIYPKQVAALLVPLQMRFKYLVAERGVESQELVALSQCNYGHENEDGKVSLIMISRASPVPVVFGYFPFDAEGAVESPKTSSNGLKNACFSAPPVLTADGRIRFNRMGGNPIDIAVATTSEIGPCGALCRGACGADCEPNNCNESKELRCEKDEMGLNTGMVVQYLIYDCGMHQGCIDHDSCYDRCNETYGCDTWMAEACRHDWSVIGLFTDNNTTWYCDQRAVTEHGSVNPVLWTQGLGPQPIRKTFEYIDEEYEKQWNPEKCPEDTSEIPLTEDESVSIPVGTYSGESNFYTTLENDVDDSYLEPVCTENTVNVVIASDGTVQGELRSICYSKEDTDSEEMQTTHHSEVTGVIKGEMLDMSGHLSIAYTWRTYLTSPQWEAPSLDKTIDFEFLYNVNVSNDVMTFTPAGDVEDYYTFELTKE